MKGQIPEWILLDTFLPAPSVYEEEDRPFQVIRSERQLRQLLSEYQSKNPRILSLSRNDDSGRVTALGVAIGGLFGAVQCSNGVPVQRILIARVNLPYTDSERSYVCEGVETPFSPRTLFPAGDVIEIVVHYFLHQELAPWVEWRDRLTDTRL